MRGPFGHLVLMAPLDDFMSLMKTTPGLAGFFVRLYARVNYVYVGFLFLVDRIVRVWDFSGSLLLSDDNDDGEVLEDSGVVSFDVCVGSVGEGTEDSPGGLPRVGLDPTGAPALM